MTTRTIAPGAVLECFRRNAGSLLTLKEILAILTQRGRGVKGARKQVLGHLHRLVESGAIEQAVGGYRLVRRDALLEGRVETFGEDSGSSLSGTLVDDNEAIWNLQSTTPLEPGQRVLFAPLEGDEGAAAVVDVVEDAPREWVGVLQSARQRAYVDPFNSRERWRVSIARSALGGAEDGDLVVVEPDARGRRGQGNREQPRGRVVERLGKPGDPEADFRAIAWNHKLRVQFDARVEREVAAIPEALDAAELKRRLDLRERAFLTIDPATARDHDDAVCLETTASGLRLWVAIADVSYYVRDGSALDREAQQRGNSVYFPDRVVPMLPERISTDLCSLRAGRDRFAMAVEMVVGADGRVSRSSFYPTVIRSRASLSYEQAAELMEGSGEPSGGFAPEVVEQVRLLAQLEACLSKRRFENGSIDFALSESRVEVDASGRPEAIVTVARTRAHRAVEEAMLVANQSVAECLTRNGMGGIYRIHERPEESKLEVLEEHLSSFGLLDKRRSGRLGSAEIHRALKRAEGRPEAPLVNLVALRSLKQARYSEFNQGHFALGFDSYLHFTSPIRRYADLVVHRALSHWLEVGARPLEPSLGSPQRLGSVAKHISYRERVAVDAERAMSDLKKCVFMSGYVGQAFSGTITGVASHGVYVTLDEHDVNGLIPSATLGSGLILDEGGHALVARRSGARFQLGDTMDIVVEDVNLARGWIRFDLQGNTSPRRSNDRARGAKPKRGSGKRPKTRKGRPSKRKVRRSGAPSRGRGRR